jgi:hypothetical protein
VGFDFVAFTAGFLAGSAVLAGIAALFADSFFEPMTAFFPERNKFFVPFINVLRYLERE